MNPPRLSEQKFEDIDFNTWPRHPFEPLEIESSSRLSSSLLPESMRELVVAISRELEVPLELPFACALGVISTVCQSRWSVCIKPEWTEPTSLFIAVPADPGERKTPTLRKLMDPLIGWEKCDRERCRQENESNVSKSVVIGKKIKALESEAAKTDDVAGLVERMEILRDELPAEQKPRRLFVDDTTPEQLVRQMAQQGGAIAVISDEGGAFLRRIAGHYSGAPNIDAVLKGWDNGPLRVDRANGRDVYLNNARLSLLLLMQASVARDVLINAEFMQRGLVHRFLWLLPGNNHIGKRTGQGAAVPKHLLSRWSSLVAELLSWSPAGTADCGTTTHMIQLTDAARERHHRYAQAIELAIGGMDEADPRRTYRQKWPGQTARLAGVLHCVEQATSGIAPHGAMITDVRMQEAIALGSVLLDHADLAMAMLGQDLRLERAKRIFKRVVEHGEPISAADLWRKLRKVTTLFDDKSQFDDALELLIKKGYVAWWNEGKIEWLIPTPPALAAY